MDPHNIVITVEDKLAEAEAELARLKMENNRLKRCLINTPHVMTLMVEVNYNALNGREVNLTIAKWLEERANLIG